MVHTIHSSNQYAFDLKISDYRNVNDLTKCECPSIACTKEYNPVCATNGIDSKLYGNLCILRSANCNFKHGKHSEKNSNS